MPGLRDQDVQDRGRLLGGGLLTFGFAPKRDILDGHHKM